MTRPETAMRISIQLTDAQVHALDSLATMAKRSRVALIRDAVADYLARRSAHDPLNDAFGLWKDRQIDGIAYQQGLRRDW